MAAFLARRLGLVLVTFFGITVFSFVLILLVLQSHTFAQTPRVPPRDPTAPIGEDGDLRDRLTRDMAKKANDVQGYVIEVKGYASSTGSTEVNQKLSQDRANNVTNILLQKANVPLTRILAPGAMVESQQVNNDKSAEGQAENRRVVVRVLQNKAIAGI